MAAKVYQTLPKPGENHAVAGETGQEESAASLKSEPDWYHSVRRKRISLTVTPHTVSVRCKPSGAQ
jgi:hypothetical protein